EDLRSLFVPDLRPLVDGGLRLGRKRRGGLVDRLRVHGRPGSASRRTCAKCLVLSAIPSRAARPARCMRQLVSPETRTSGFAARTWSSFRSPMAAETCGNATENVPPKPQHCSASPNSTRRRPSIERSSRATASPLAVPRVWHERCRATEESNMPGQDLTPSPFTMKSPSSHVRRPRPSTSPRSGSCSNSRRAPWKSIAAQEPEGTTTGSSPRKVRTACRTTLRDAAQSPPLKAGWPQHVWPSGKSTSQPRCSSTSTVAAATSSWNASHRHVAISWTRLPATGARPDPCMTARPLGVVQTLGVAMASDDRRGAVHRKRDDRLPPRRQAPLAARPARPRAQGLETRVQDSEPGHFDPGRPCPPQRLAPDRLHLDIAAGEEVDEARGAVRPHRRRHVELALQVFVGDPVPERRGRALDLAHELAGLAGQARVGADPVGRDPALGDREPVERDVPDKLLPPRLEQVLDDMAPHPRRLDLRRQGARPRHGGPAELADRDRARVKAPQL